MVGMYTQPGVKIEEQTATSRPITGTPSSIPGLLAVALKGPVRQPMLVQSLDEAARIFGDYNRSHPLLYLLRAFFENGGNKAYVSRLAHYTDLADESTAAGAASSADLNGAGAATRAAFTGNVAIPSTFQTDDGHQLVFSVNGGADKTVTIQATPAVKTGAAGAFTSPVPADVTAKITIGSVTSNIVIPAGGVVTVDDYANAINAQLAYASVMVVGGQLEITTDQKGSFTSIEISDVGADWVATTGLTAGLTASAGPNNVEDCLRVTQSEIVVLIEDAVKTASPGDLLDASFDAANFLQLRVVAGTAGVANTLNLKNTSTAALVAALGLTGMGTYDGGAAEAGTASTAQVAATISAGYKGYPSPGVHGDKLSVTVVANPAHASLGVALDLASNAVATQSTLELTTATGIQPGSFLRLSDGVLEEFVEVKSITLDNSGSTPKYVVTLVSALALSWPRLTSTCESCEVDIVVSKEGTEVERFKQVSSNPNGSRYYGAVINDPVEGSRYIYASDAGLAFPLNVIQAAAVQSLANGAEPHTGLTSDDIVGSAVGKTGMYAFDDYPEMGLPCLVQSANGDTTVVTSAKTSMALLSYAGTRKDCFAVLDTPPSLAPAAARTYRLNTLGADSAWGGLYYPHLVAADPIGVGNNPEFTISPVGHVLGLFARVDKRPGKDGGPSCAPAGVGDFGRLTFVKRPATKVSDSQHGDLNEVGVNVILDKGVQGTVPVGVCVYGARTLSTDINWRYLNVRRMMTYIQQSIARGTTWAVFRNNDSKLQTDVATAVAEFLRREWQAGHLPGQAEDEAFFVVCDASTNPPEGVEAGELRCRVGVALHRPSEFVIFETSQTSAGALINE